MLSFVLKRTIQVLPVLLLASVIVWGLLYLIPGDPIVGRLGPDATPVQVAAEREKLGLDEPVVVQYVEWLRAALGGDFGESFVNARPVGELIVDRLPPTLALTIGGLLLATLVGVPLGVIAGCRSRGWAPFAVRTYSSLALAVPTFWVGILLVLVFSLTLGLLPSSGYVPFAESPQQWARHLILPVVTLGFFGSGIVARFVATSVAAELAAAYIWTARAKGLPEKRVIVRHALRNALVPLVTVLGLQLGLLLGGAVLIEAVFNLPGLGRLLLDSVIRRDYTVTQTLVLFILVGLIVVNLLVDVVYGLLDPRIRV